MKKSIKSIGLSFLLIISALTPCSIKSIAPIPSSIYTMNLQQVNATENILNSLSATLALAGEAKQKDDLYLYLEFVQMTLEKYSGLMKILFPHTNPTSYSFNEIDSSWLAEVNANLQQQKDFLDRSEPDDRLPTFSQSLLLEIEKKIIENPNIMIGLSAGSGSHQIKSLLNFFKEPNSDYFNQKNKINVTRLPNLDQRLFILYHEFGHAMNHDAFNGIAIRDGKKNYDDFFINDPRILHIDHYTQLGIKLIDSSSSIGSVIKNVLSELKLRPLMNIIQALIAPIAIPAGYIYYLVKGNKSIHDSTFCYILKEFVKEFHSSGSSKTPFWIPPTNTMALSKYTYLRNTEKCADLFALEHLYEQNFIHAILRWVEYLVSCGKDHNELCPPDQQYVISANQNNDGTQDEHPSHIERALYALGFLAAHGIDINKALRDYEVHGQCVDGENMKAVVSHLQSNKCPAANNA